MRSMERKSSAFAECATSDGAKNSAGFGTLPFQLTVVFI